MNKEEYLKEKGYDVRTILNYFPNNPDKLEKIINEYHPELEDVVYNKISLDEEEKFIDKIYEIVKDK